MIKIENEELIVEIKEVGAELTSIKTTYDLHEYLYQPKEPYWKRQSPVLFPIVGKMKEDTYYLNDQKYMMPKHGLCRDIEFTVVENKSDYALFSIVLDHHEAYPFKCELLISYQLEHNTLLVGYEVKNLGSSLMPFSIGGHPAFAWPSDAYMVFEKENLERYRVEPIYVSRTTEAMYLDQGVLPLTHDLFTNDALIFKGLNRLEYYYDERSIKVKFDGFPWLGVWSMSDAPFVCIEPWYGLNDFEDHNMNIFDKEGIEVLNGYETFKTEYSIEIE